MKHTPEPWGFDKAPNAQLFTLFSEANGIHEYIGYIRTKEDAERIINCVNPMKKINDPKGLMEVVLQLELDAYPKLKEQHERVLNTLENLVNAVKFRVPLSPSTIHELVEAEKVLEAVKGKKHG